MARLPRSTAERTSNIRQLIPGAAAGLTRVIAPPSRPYLDLGTVDVPPYMPFSRETVRVSESGAYELRFGGPLGVWIMKLRVAGSSTTTVDVKQNGVVLDSLSLASGETRAELDLSSYQGAPGDDMNVECTLAGSGAEGLVILAPIR